MAFMRRALTAMLVGASLLTITVSTGYASPENPTTTELVTAIRDTYKTVNTIRADFTQVREDPVTHAKDQQKGKLALKRPKKMRFDFTSPAPRTFVSDGQTLWIYDPGQKQVIEQQDLSGSAGLGVLLDDLSKLDELFNVSIVPEKTPKSTYTVHLLPRQPGAFQSLDLTIAKQKYVLQDLVLVDSMNFSTEMHFSSVRFDTDVPDSEFTFVAPPGVQVIKTGG